MNIHTVTGTEKSDALAKIKNAVLDVFNKIDSESDSDSKLTVICLEAFKTAVLTANTIKSEFLDGLPENTYLDLSFDEMHIVCSAFLEHTNKNVWFHPYSTGGLELVSLIHAARIMQSVSDLEASLETPEGIGLYPDTITSAIALVDHE